MSNINFFESQTQLLQEDFNNQKQDAIIRYNSIFFNKEKPILINFQHIVAKEASFENWNELLISGKNKQRVAKILYKNKNLDDSGIKFNWQNLKNEQNEQRIIDRRELLNNSDFIIKLSKFLKNYVIPTKTIRSKYSSYKIKHIIERSISKFGFNEEYVSNGKLITAAILAGFKFKPCNNTELNVFFNMEQSSLE